MRFSVRAVAALSVGAACMSAAVPSAVAGTSDQTLAAATDGAAASSKGDLLVCNNSGYMFDVYADGPEVRKADLGDECSDWWKPVEKGTYDLGFALRIPSEDNLIIQVRVRRGQHTFYKVFNSSGQVKARVAPGEMTKVDLFIPRK